MPDLFQYLPPLVEPISLGAVMLLVYRLLHPALVASLKPRVSVRVQLRTFVVALAYVGALLVALAAVAWIARAVRA